MYLNLPFELSGTNVQPTGGGCSALLCEFFSRGLARSNAGMVLTLHVLIIASTCTRVKEGSTLGSEDYGVYCCFEACTVLNIHASQCGMRGLRGRTIFA